MEEERKSLGKWLQEQRAARGWTQAQLATRIGVSLSAVRNYEGGHRTPELSVRQRIASEFGLTVSDLRSLAEKPSAKVAPGSEQPPSYLRVGITPFWDTALISAFDMLFAAYQVEVEFVPLPAWHEAVHREFRTRRIDLAIHNEFLLAHDRHSPEPSPPEPTSCARRRQPQKRPPRHSAVSG